MKRKIILTCAVTGGAQLSKNSQYVPITPVQIADEALAAAAAGAASVHIHVRDPETGAPSMVLDHYRAVVERIRENNTNVIINLTAGMGAGYAPPLEEGQEATAVVETPLARTIHVTELKPDICTLDIATMNFGDRSIVNAPNHLALMAKMVGKVNVKPELEVFDLGHLELANIMLGKGQLPEPPFFQFCLGIPGGAPATPESMLIMKSRLPENAVWSAFGISRSQMPMVAQSVILGGNCRVGLEDNLYLERGVLAKGNAPLVERARTIIECLGCDLATPDEAREILSIS